MNSAFFNLQEMRDNPFLRRLYDFAQLHEVELYLVGGSVRDLLLKRPTTDIDFTLQSDTLRFSKMFADSIKAPFITLEEQPATARVVVRTPDHVPSEFHIDFTEFRAETLTEDLLLRDLTINAMAISLESVMESDHPEVIDPCDGREDLASNLLQFPNEQVVVDDPLRLMRIYRLAAQLDFEISEHSFAQIQKLRHLLPNVSRERIRDELLKTLNVEKSTRYLSEMNGVSLLEQVFPNIKITSRLWDWLNDFEDNPIPESLESCSDEINTVLNEELGLFANRKTLIKLCLLLQDNLGDIGDLLKLSRKSVLFMRSLVGGHQLLLDCDFTKYGIIDFLRTTVTDLWCVLLFSTVIHPIHAEKLLMIVDIYYNHFLPILKRGRFITGEDLMHELGLKEGKRIGVLLEEIEKRRFYGEIESRDEAIKVVKDLVRK